VASSLLGGKKKKKEKIITFVLRKIKREILTAPRVQHCVLRGTREGKKKKRKELLPSVLPPKKGRKAKQRLLREPVQRKSKHANGALSTTKKRKRLSTTTTEGGEGEGEGEVMCSLMTAPGTRDSGL